MKIKNLNEKKQPQQPNDEDILIWQDVVSEVQKIKQRNIHQSKPQVKEFVIKNNVNIFEQNFLTTHG